MRIKYIIYITFLYFIFFAALPACREVRTEDPEKAFQYWTGVFLTDEKVEVLEGCYWRGAHFTLEHEVFLKIKASGEWKNEFKEDNLLKLQTGLWESPPETPEWFIPSGDYSRYGSQDNPAVIYWEKAESDTVYIYESLP